MSQRPCVVVFDPLSWVSDFDYATEVELLAIRGVDLVVPENRDQRNELISEASVVVAAGLDEVTASDIEKMSACVGIVAAQSGTEHIDHAAAEAADLPVLNLAVSTEEVADHAMALLLAAKRRIVVLNDVAKARNWSSLEVAERSELRRLRGQTLGVVGPGRVGRAVAARSKAFGFEVLATGRRPRPMTHRGTVSPDAAAGIEHVPLVELLERSDAIVVCADLNPSSRGLLGPDAFAQMKEGVVLVNVSRGAIVDERALLDALDSGRVSVAALDVRHPEPPNPASDPLSSHRNVIQTPHVAGASRESRDQLHHATAERVLELLEGAGLVERHEDETEHFEVSRIHHVDEFEDLAQAVLSDATFGYVAGGAGLETSVGRNRQSLDSVSLVPRVMRDVHEVRTHTSLLGEGLAFPLVIAPSAVQRLAHRDGEVATARAVKEAGLLMVLSMNSSTTMERVAAEGVPFWMQLYMSPDRRHMEDILKRAEGSGARALCLTVDHAGMPTRLRELHQPLVVPPEVEFVHLDPDASRRGIDRRLTWEVVEWIRSVSELPIVLKGVLHPDDVRLAAEAEIDAVILSNHGGRQLDSSVSAYDVIASALEVKGDKMELLADGGIRSGTDLLKVLAMGARAGLIGRPVWWGLAAAGEAGVQRVIELITQELVESMRLCGVASVDEVSRDILLD